MSQRPRSAVITFVYGPEQTQTLTLDDGMTGMLVTWLSKFPAKKQPLTAAQVGECLVRLDQGATWADLATSFGISESALRQQVPYSKSRRRGRRADPARDQMAFSLRRAGRTWNEVAEALGVSLATAQRMAARAV